MRKFGLLGAHLPHSYSPAIHEMLGDYEYLLYEKNESELSEFLTTGDVQGLNVTIPYKKAVIPYLSELGDTARETGSVNTIVRRDGGVLFGDNTDVYGFMKMVEHAGLSVEGQKVLVLGSGGASVAVVVALRRLKALPVVISRSGPDNYDNLEKHRDATVIVNSTPVGMYPEVGKAPLDLSVFPALKGVLDLIYNPARTALLMQAEQLGVVSENGLYMLVAQAKKSSEIFTGHPISDEVIDEIYGKLKASMQNTVLIGMPGCGKTTVATALSELTGRKMVDSDSEIERRTGRTPKDWIEEEGEDAFRRVESEVLRDLGKESGLIIATGGGVVTREENYAALHQNGLIVWLTRPLDALDATGRPLSQREGVAALYAQREPLYRRFADITIANDDTCDARAVAASLKRTIT